jgi:hypothetical protein
MAPLTLIRLGLLEEVDDETRVALSVSSEPSVLAIVAAVSDCCSRNANSGGVEPRDRSPVALGAVLLLCR